MSRPSSSPSPCLIIRQNERHRKWRRSLLFVLLALLLLATASIAAGRPGGAVTVPNSIALVSQTPWVTTTKGMQLTVAIRSGIARKDLGLVVTLYSVATERGYFEETLAGDTSDFTVLTTSPVLKLTTKGLVAADGDATVDLPVASPGVPGRQPTRAPREGAVLTLPCTVSCAGVYPLQVSLEDLTTYTPLDSFMTYLILAPERALSPLRFSFVLPLGTSPAFSRSGTADPSARTEGEIERIAAEAAANPRTDFSLALYPQLLDSLRQAASATVDGKKSATRRPAPGAKAAQRALGAARALATLPNVELTDETYAPIDLSGAAVAKARREAATQFRAGREALGDFGVDASQRPFVSVDPLGPRGLALARAAGVHRMLVPADSVTPVPTSWIFPVWAPFIVRRGDVEADASDGNLVNDLSVSTDPALRANQLLADLAVLYFVEQPPGNRGVTLLAPTGWVPKSAFFSTFFAGLASSPVVQSVTLSNFFSEVPAGSDEIPNGDALSPLLYRGLVAPDVPREDILPLNPIRVARAMVGSLSTLLPHDPRLIEKAEDLILVGESAGLEPSTRLSYFDAPRAEMAREMADVSLPRKRTITITSLAAKIPISVASRDRTPLDVDLRLSSCPLPAGSVGCRNGDLSFTHHVFRLSPLLPGNRTIEVHVSARSSGDFFLYLELTTPDGGTILADSRVLIRSTAISGVAIVLTVVAAAFLVLWWGRSALRRRRGRGRTAGRDDVTDTEMTAPSSPA